MADDYDISPIQKLVFMASRDPVEPPEPSPLKMISFRVPIELVADVDALASMTSQSRNTTMIDLLRAGVYAVVNELDDPALFHDIRDQILGE